MTRTLVGFVFSQAMDSVTLLASSPHALVMAVRRAYSSAAPAAVRQADWPLKAARAIVSGL
ncbi:MAG TPA: hypothetical protein VIX14_07915 [Terriglobales bacterium]